MGDVSITRWWSNDRRLRLRLRRRWPVLNPRRQLTALLVSIAPINLSAAVPVWSIAPPAVRPTVGARIAVTGRTFTARPLAHLTRFRPRCRRFVHPVDGRWGLNERRKGSDWLWLVVDGSNRSRGGRFWLYDRRGRRGHCLGDNRLFCRFDDLDWFLTRARSAGFRRWFDRVVNGCNSILKIRQVDPSSFR